MPDSKSSTTDGPPEPNTKNSEEKLKLEPTKDTSVYLSDWGFTLKELYNLALVFFKDKEGKALHFTYEERLKLIGLTCQVTNGKFDPQTAPPLGVLDVIGKDRRMAWQALGDKSKEDSMHEFVSILDRQSPLFKPFIEAHKTAAEEKKRAKVMLDQQELEANGTIQSNEQKIEEENEERKRRIQDALNRQTFPQFKVYAEQQFPGNPEQQGVLIRQLQEQHYEQYMRQIYQEQLFTETGELNDKVSDIKISSDNECGEQFTPQPNPEAGEHDATSSVAAASMWTRKDVKEFKDSVKSEGGEAIIRIGQGESVTVRVPTHEDGTCLFWEFATDAYDIGFGLFFEWTNAEETVSVEVTEDNSSEDEEDDPELAAVQEDIEKGRELLPKGAKPNTEVIIPVYRRDSHQEVYVGSHLFPGKGVYLLKFDNSYSFWRSKTLYYRVYYTK